MKSHPHDASLPTETFLVNRRNAARSSSDDQSIGSKRRILDLPRSSAYALEDDWEGSEDVVYQIMAFPDPCSTDEHIEFPYGMHPLSLSTGDVKHNFLLTAVNLPSERRSKHQHCEIIQKVSMGRWLCLSDGTITEVDEEAIPDRYFGLKNDISSAKCLLYTNTDQDDEQLHQMMVVEDSQQPQQFDNNPSLNEEMCKLLESEMIASFKQGIPDWLPNVLNQQATMLTTTPLGSLPLECAFRHLDLKPFKTTPLSLVSSFTTKLKDHPSPIEAQQLVNLSLSLMCKSHDGDSSSLDTLFHEMEHRDSRAVSKLDTWKIVEIIASFPELLTYPDVLNHFYSTLASILEDQSQLAMLFTFTSLFTNQFLQVAQSTILCDEHSASAFLAMVLESGINKSINPTRITRLWTAHPDHVNTNLPILLGKASRMRLIPTFIGDLVEATFFMFLQDRTMSKGAFELDTVAKHTLASSSLTKFFVKLQTDLIKLFKSRPSLRPPIRDILFRTVLKEPVDGVFPRYDEMYNAYQTAVDETALESTFKRKEYQIPSTVADEFLTYNKQFPPPHDNEAISDIWRLFFLLTFGNHQRTILKKLPDNMQDHFLSLWIQNDTPLAAQQLVNLSLSLMCKSHDGDSSSLDTLFHEMEHRDSRAVSKLDTWKIVEIIASFPELLTYPDVLNHFYSTLASILEDQSQLAMLFTFTSLFTNQFLQVAQSTILCDEHSASAFLAMVLESGINKSINPTRITRLWTAHPDHVNTNLPILLGKASRMRLIPTFIGDLVEATFFMFLQDRTMSKGAFELDTVAKHTLASSSLTKFFVKLQTDLIKLFKSRPSLRPPIRDILFRTVLKEPVDGVFPPYDEMYNAYKTAVDKKSLTTTFKREDYLNPSPVADEFTSFNEQFPPPHEDEAISDVWRLPFLLKFGNHQNKITNELPNSMQSLILNMWTKEVQSDWNLKCLHAIFTVTLPFKDRFLRVIHDCLREFHFPVHPTPTQSFLVLSMLSAYDLWIQKSKYQTRAKSLKLLSDLCPEQTLCTIIRTLVDDIKPKDKNVRTSPEDHLSDNIRELLLSIAKQHPSDRSNILRESMLRVLSELNSVDSYFVSLLFHTLCETKSNAYDSNHPLQITRSHPVPLLIYTRKQTTNFEPESFIFGTIPIIFTAFVNAMDSTSLDDLLRGTDSPSIPDELLGEVLLVLSHPLFHPQIRFHSLQFLQILMKDSLVIQRMVLSSLICAHIPEYSEALDRVQAYEVGSESSPPTLDMDRSIIEQYLPDAFIFPRHNSSFPKLPSLPLLLSSSPSVLIGKKYIGLDVTPKVDKIRDALIDKYLEKLKTSDPVWVVVFCAYFFKYCNKMPFYDTHKAKVETMLFNMELWENLKNSTTHLTDTQLGIITEIVKREDLSPNSSSKEKIVLLLE
ncbi:hypothetical protein BLNAU_8061 [Blattamonas nauphoetae]|uniref:Uncharacterized protein n=1 Tax=Blattamonas nauphoetae TaxID=2049346 RepID=A0ABQ9XZS6_9EUKA|nr:hypothetical protein BLNAU_8061 [Blattamonas nauphoetae]